MSVVASASYKPFGPLAGFTFGNGLVAALTFDQDYQLTNIQASNGTTTVQNLVNGFDPSGNITSITDSLASSRSQAVTYVDLNRVATASGAYGLQSYSYDGVGNRMSRTANGSTERYAYSATSNRLGTVSSTNGNVRSLTYAASGQLSQDVRDASDTYAFSVNNNGRNAGASLNGSAVGSYLYNAFGQRVQKVTGGITTQFVYDRLGHRLEEANGSGTVLRDYIWFDDVPVAMVDDTGASPVTYYIHTDQLGFAPKGRPRRARRISHAAVRNSSPVAGDCEFQFGPLGRKRGRTARIAILIRGPRSARRRANQSRDRRTRAAGLAR